MWYYAKDGIDWLKSHVTVNSKIISAHAIRLSLYNNSHILAWITELHAAGNKPMWPS